MRRKQLPFWLFTASLFIVFIVRDLFKEGMFLDGTVLFAVGKNLSHGLGSFWNPHYTQTLMTDFHQQPPLLFGIEAIFFKILGDSYLTDRLYCLFFAMVSFWLITLIWKKINPSSKNLSWLPILLVIISPLCFWSFINGVVEITMGAFVLASVLLILKGLENERRVYLYFSLAGGALIGASLCKGVQGLFPLTAVFFYWLIFRNISFMKMLRYSFFIFLVVAVFYGVIAQNHAVQNSYVHYFQDRIVTTFQNAQVKTTQTRFYLLYKLFMELLPPILLTLLTILIIKKASKENLKVTENNRKYILFFLLLGLSGTIPLMITLEQRGFYLLTAMPYFIFSLALCCLNEASLIVEKANKQFKLITVSLFILGLIFTGFDITHSPKRDKELIHDMKVAGQVIPHGEVISIKPELYTDWTLHAYFSRYLDVSLDPNKNGHRYFWTLKNDVPKISEYKRIPLETMKYDLYAK